MNTTASYNDKKAEVESTLDKNNVIHTAILKYQQIRKYFLPGMDFWLLEYYLVLLVFLDQNIYTPLDVDLVLPKNKNGIQLNLCKELFEFNI